MMNIFITTLTCGLNLNYSAVIFKTYVPENKLFLIKIILYICLDKLAQKLRAFYQSFCESAKKTLIKKFPSDFCLCENFLGKPSNNFMDDVVIFM